MRTSTAVRIAVFLALSSGVSSRAVAAVTISTATTQNMTCSGGVCVPTATDAVLNTGDLQTMLAAGNLSVLTTNGSIQANDIVVAAPFAWAAASTITLDAYHSITVTGAVRNDGAGGVTLVTDDGGSGGTLSFLGGGHIRFSNLKDALFINGTRYKLAATIKELTYDIVAHPKGAFALATDYDAKQDGAYTGSPIAIPFTGSFSGLGHTISHLEIENVTDLYLGFFAEVATSGSISGVNLQSVVVRGGGNQATGGLVGLNDGAVTNASTSGVINAPSAGGLVGINYGTIFRSSSSATVHGTYGAGGLVSQHAGGLIAESFATGEANYDHQRYSHTDDGGLVADVFAPVRDSYAEGNLYDTNSVAYEGGLVGFINEVEGKISTSYSTGIPRPRGNPNSGGLVGNIYMDAKFVSNCYWDTTTSKTNIGVGGSGDESGITGLTTAQLQSGLPSGFDPTIWAENPTINGGLPYLIANPPQ